MSYTIMRTLWNGMAVLHPLYCPGLASFLFWKLKLALKGRRCGVSSTIQEQSPVVCSPNSGEDGRHLLGTEH